MTLEESVTNTIRFDDERQRAMVNLVYTYNIFLEQTLQALHPFDLNDQHYNVLKTLDYHYPTPIAVGEIKRMLFNKRGDLTRLLDKLCAHGLAVRAVAEEDRRVVLVTISEVGRTQLQLMDARLTEYRDSRNQLSIEEAHQLNLLLDKMRG